MEPIGLCVAIKHPVLIVKTAAGCHSGSLFHENVKERTSLGGSQELYFHNVLYRSQRNKPRLCSEGNHIKSELPKQKPYMLCFDLLGLHRKGRS